MKPAKILRMDPRHTKRVAASPREPLVERILCILVGSSIAAFGFGLAALCLASGSIAALLPAAPLTFIGIFGLNLVVQGVRARSRHEGFFYTLLNRLVALGPRIWSLLLPSAALVSILIAALTNDHDALDLSVRALAGWLVLMVNVAVHELGHFVAATALKLRVRRLIVGPLELSVLGSTWQLELSREWLSIFGGFIALVPRSAPLTPKQELAFAAGGPIATILLLACLLALSPFDLVALFRTSPSTLQHDVFSLGVVTGVGALVLNLMPSRQLVLGSPSDGYQIAAAVRSLLGRTRRRGAAARRG